MATTGYTITSAKFDNTAIENPYYETSSKRDTLVDEMKNNQIIIDNNLLIIEDSIIEEKIK
ncbi:hypothetical protein ACE01N_00775 [Saccharicrinis sp. FJH2]|uniref:hypothetical protein n=1 Tax=Saccharicrinis sp. FJH65 TaxID=3344659 RepID=UPI0035F26F07